MFGGRAGSSHAGWWCVISSSLLSSTPLWAADYEVPFDFASEAELDELYTEGTISEETRETLRELLQTKLDLDAAERDELYTLPGLSYSDVDRILAHRARAGHLQDPFELSDAGVLTQQQVARLLPFLVLREVDSGDARENTTPSAAPIRRRKAQRKSPWARGRVQLRTRATLGDRVAPPLLIGARLELPAGVSLGAALATTRLQLGRVRAAPAAGSLIADGARYRAEVAKAFIHWQTPRWSLLAGSFRVGFAERLTLDTTRRPFPDGAYPDDLVRLPQDSSRYCRYSAAGGAPPVCAETGAASLYVTSDVDAQSGFRGVALSVPRLALGPDARLTLHGFASYQPRAIYQYDVFDRRTCVDPRDEAAGCAAPAVFEAPDAERRFAFVTLPHAYDELAAGGHADLVLRDALRWGVTGYYAEPRWRVPGAALDFQESSRFPWGGPFGAVGANASARLGVLSLFFEGARSFDHTPQGGGLGLTQRSLASLEAHELELSLRYFDPNFANPHARPTAAPDELEGLRARNELGQRLHYGVRLGEALRLRATSDVWTLPSDGKIPGSAGTMNLALQARFDLAWRLVRLAGWADYINKGLAHNGPGLCYDAVATELGLEVDERVSGTCHGELARVTGRLARVPAGRGLSAAAQYGHAFVTDPKYPRAYRQDALLVGELGLRPFEQLLVRLRCRYVDRAIDEDQRSQRWLTAHAAVDTAAGRTLTVRAHYGLTRYLDQRASTLARRPNPEHSLQLQIESRF